MKLTIFLLLEASPDWLALERQQRAEIAQEALARAFRSEGLSLRYFDAEAFNARVSDVAMIEAESPETYYFAIEKLRDSPLIAQRYFRVIDIIPSFEDGYHTFEQTQNAA